jgi:hypothetical protein
VAKVLISIDDHLLERLDEEARHRGVTRSKLVSELASKELGPETGPGADPEVHAAIARLRELFRTAPYADKRDSTEIIREMRDSR